MKTYKVMRIMEQDFGCEERPDDKAYTVDVVLINNETGQNLTVSIADDELYHKNIDVGSLVTYDGTNMYAVKDL